jgi:pyruvate/2-oxoglutarate dehydrogenase complex dihydrolipoamide acyltransferase (E2) component
VSSSLTDSVTVEVTMPQMGVSVAEGTIVAWCVAVGDEVSADQTICEVSTDKIDTEVPAPSAGVVTEILVAVEETVPVGAVLARIGTSEAAQTEAAAAPTTSMSRDDTHEVTQGHRPRYYSPVVQRIAAERNVDLAGIDGTGVNGRVRKQDVLAVADPPGEAPMHTESPYRPDTEPSPVAPPVRGTGRLGETGTLSRMRRQIGAHMKRSLDTAATCTTWMEADMGAVERARREAGLTALAYVAAATVAALGRHPALNATLEGERYTVHPGVHLGIAVSLGEEGLIVPVIRDAQTLSVAGLAREITDLARRARSGDLAPDDIHGGTFTITNPGRYGTMMATPVINQPQVAILDLEAIIKRPVVIEAADGHDGIGIRPVTILGLSWDHRALDGVLAAQFLASVRDGLANPGR